MKFIKNEHGRNRAFSFIELLIVISIIAILASVGAVSYTMAQKKSRDGKRKSDLESLRSALEMYRVDNSFYPADPGTLIGGYMTAVPHDPKCPGGSCSSGFTDYSYTRNTVTTYTLCACKLESSGTEDDYCVQNP